ncbi:MAG: hypothetical protein KC592_18050 [Nitrospira sp.]|nr:hypothetical protein [Nitrospira sp.]
MEVRISPQDVESIVKDLLSIEDLKEWTGYQRTQDVKRWLAERDIKWWNGKDHQPCTTIQAINDKLIDSHSNEVSF